MFKISRRINYGLQMMIYLANSDQPKVPTADIAEALNLPLPFLHQIGNTLTRQGLVQAVPGPRGGMRLGKKAEDITLLEIYESIEDKFDKIAVEDDETDNVSKEQKVAAKTFQTFGEGISKMLSDVKLSDLAEQAK